MISVNEAIARFRRDVTVSTLLKVGLGVGAAVVTMLHFLPKRPLDPTLLLMLLGVVWLNRRAARKLQREIDALDHQATDPH